MNRRWWMTALALVMAGCGLTELTLADEVSGVDLAESELAACACPNPTGDPIGGGAGYRRIVSPTAPRTTVARSVAALDAALTAARSGDTVYVADDVTLDLTGRSQLTVNAGVTLASGRGREGGPGGRLLARATHGTALPLLVLKEGARLTGLRIQGPDQTVGASKDATPRFTGVKASGLTKVEIDNNEVFGWVYALRFDLTTGAHVHHNDIHHNQRVELGYGVLLGGDYDDVLIEANTFDFNRHAVAGSGYRGESYEARYNRVGPNANGHVFDMHGEAEKGLSSPYAGDRINIHHNTVFNTSQKAVIIRGRPYTQARVENNCLAHASQTAAVWQRYYTGNLVVGANHYLTTQAQCSLERGSCTSLSDGTYRFVDTICSPFRQEAEWLADQRITLGCNPPANDRFCPANSVTRGQMAAFFTRALNLPPGPPDAFTDDDGSVFEPAIDALAASGITRGCNPPANDRFCPNDAVTRGQMAAFLDRAFQFPDGPDAFPAEGGTFEGPINACVQADVMRGCTADSFCAGTALRRDELARAFHRAMTP